MAESFGVTLLLVMVGLFFLFRFVFLWYWKIDKILSELQQQTDWMKKTAINTKYPPLRIPGSWPGHHWLP